MTRTEVRRTVQTRMRLSGLGLRGYVRSIGLSEGYASHLSQFLSGEVRPMPGLLKALGYRLVNAENYVQVGNGRVTERAPRLGGR